MMIEHTSGPDPVIADLREQVAKLEKRLELSEAGNRLSQHVIDGWQRRAERAEAHLNKLGEQEEEVRAILSRFDDSDGHITDTLPAIARYAVLCVDRAEARAESESQHLGNLLAVIHGDGGHYRAEHGTEKAVEDAHIRLANERARAEAVPQLVEALVAHNNNARSFFQIANRIATEFSTHELATNFGAFADTTQRMLTKYHAITNKARDALAEPSGPWGTALDAAKEGSRG